jgi:hypothetical protein
MILGPGRVGHIEGLYLFMRLQKTVNCDTAPITDRRRLRTVRREKLKMWIRVENMGIIMLDQGQGVYRWTK